MRGLHSDPLPQSRAWGEHAGALAESPDAQPLPGTGHAVRKVCTRGEMGWEWAVPLWPSSRNTNTQSSCKKNTRKLPVETYCTKRLSSTPQTCECYRKKKLWKLWWPGGPRETWQLPVMRNMAWTPGQEKKHGQKPKKWNRVPTPLNSQVGTGGESEARMKIN